MIDWNKFNWAQTKTEKEENSKTTRSHSAWYIKQSIKHLLQ